MSGALPEPSPPRGLVALAATVTGMFVVSGLAAMWLLAPRVPYADTWRFLHRFLAEPFPTNVLAADNGHREVLPNAVRVAELAWFDANQMLQTGLGLALALLFLGIVWRTVRPLAWGNRAAATVVLTAGVFWLGNGRKLAHGSEALHLFAVLCCLLGGLRALAIAPTAWRGALTAAALALVATFCFGSGVACFPAFAAVAVLQRRPPVQLLALLAAGLVALPGLLAGGDGAWPTSLRLLTVLEYQARLLGAASAWAFSPLLDPTHAARLPGDLLPTVAGAVADRAHAAFGDALAARWPALAFGLAGTAWLLLATGRAARRGAPPVALVGLGLAWFAAACTALVALLRLDYFDHFPVQLTTQRYLPWSMLLWTGLLLAHAATVARPARALLAALAFAAVLLPSSVWTARYAWKQRLTAELTAAGALVGVLGTDFPLEETLEPELRRVLPALRAAGVAMFAWPEAPVLGGPLPADARPARLRGVELTAVPNRFGPPGCAVVLAADDGAPARLVLAGPDGIVRGIALRLPFDRRWRGWLAGTCAPDALTAAALP